MMEARREQAMVGLFVLVAAAILIFVVFALSGAWSKRGTTYHTYFAFAGGIVPGTVVRYSGGPKIGRVESMKIDPADPERIEVTFSVKPDVPIKTDSQVKVMSMTPLSDNDVEIFPGTPQAGIAPPGSVLPSEPYVDFNSLAERINQLAPRAEALLDTLNERAVDLKGTVDRFNDVLSVENRANFAATIANARGMLEEDRPALKSTLQHVNNATNQLQPLLDNVQKTVTQANQSLNHIDEMVGENRPDVRQSVQELRKSLAQVNTLTGQLNQTLDVNADNIDALLENLRQLTDNLKEFTAQIKARPYLLIRSTTPPQHKPGEQK
jgi:phospholipid/cholesterol/gamma-HCH transport system substrate-binding protein